GDVFGSSVGRVLLGAVVVLVGTAIVMAASPNTPAGSAAPRKWWKPTAIDAVGLGALAMGLLAISRGTTTPSTLVSRGDPLIAMLPLLASITVAWVTIRVAPPALAAVAR